MRLVKEVGRGELGIGIVSRDAGVSRRGRSRSRRCGPHARPGTTGGPFRGHISPRRRRYREQAAIVCSHDGVVLLLLSLRDRLWGYVAARATLAPGERMSSRRDDFLCRSEVTVGLLPLSGR